MFANLRNFLFSNIVMLCGHPLLLTRLNVLKDFIPSIFLYALIHLRTEQRKFHTNMQIYKYCINQLLQCISIKVFEYAISVTGGASRNVNRLFVPQINTNCGKCSFYYRGTALWNALPTTLYDLTTFTQFEIVI